MSSSWTSAGRFVLTLVFLLAGVQKGRILLGDLAFVDDHWLLGSLPLLALLGALELGIAISMLTQLWEQGCAAAVLLAVAGSFVHAFEAPAGHATACGCFGNSPAAPLDQFMVSGAILALAGVCLWKSPAGAQGSAHDGTLESET